MSTEENKALVRRYLEAIASDRLETSGEVMAHAKLRTPDDVDEPLFAHWLRQARELELRAAP